MGDVQRSLYWYQARGFEVVATNLNWEAGPVNWAEIKRGNAQLMLTAGDRTDDDGGDSAAIRGGVTLYFRTDRVDMLYEEIGGLADVRYAPTISRMANGTSPWMIPMAICSSSANRLSKGDWGPSVLGPSDRPAPAHESESAREKRAIGQTIYIPYSVPSDLDRPIILTSGDAAA